MTVCPSRVSRYSFSWHRSRRYCTVSASHMLLIVLTGRCHSVTPSPEGNDASHDNDNDNDNDNDSDAVLTPESGQQPSLHQSGSITG